MSVNLLKGLYCGLTKPFPCAYLPDKDEQLLVVTQSPMDAERYEVLLSMGFRRNGSDVYRPYCHHCHACESVRVDVDAFSPNRRQRRVARKNSDLTLRIEHSFTPEHFDLYCRYINARHRDGGMYPPSESQLAHFAKAAWLPLSLICLYRGKQLMACAVTDETPAAYSALYTFFDPDEEARSLGTQGVLMQLEAAKARGKQWLYLGYQIDACQKMNYKTQFMPYERYSGGAWQRFTGAAS
ncbi:arginyltransferase [Gallaecimonas xiamenensis]|uniref:Aspartate/glutamate leucyltransferase n=1 Tax=Gallaecimonas xiamenensis 3-C-1 TaxID=745411 RepID=K2JRF5_9GAMM|nr:arginyltransferase [Gallaecimonas xiamenensis]EKE77983.1 arginyl-tRNA-protein transferase [Gallaecimonas xiamenensis 3-C-1]